MNTDRCEDCRRNGAVHELWAEIGKIREEQKTMEKAQAKREGAEEARGKLLMIIGIASGAISAASAIFNALWKARHGG